MISNLVTAGLHAVRGCGLTASGIVSDVLFGLRAVLDGGLAVSDGLRADHGCGLAVVSRGLDRIV